MELDPLTIIAASTVAALTIMIAVFVHAWKFPKSIKGHFTWGLALFLGVCGAGLVGGRGVIPDLYSIVLGNTMYTVMLALIVSAISQFYGDATPVKLIGICVGIVGLGMSYAYATNHGIAMRTQIAAWPNLILLCTAIWATLKGMGAWSGQAGAAAIVLSFMIAAMVGLSKVITYIGWGGGYDEILSESPIQKIYIASHGAAIFVASIGFILMGYQKISRTRIEADQSSVS